MATILTPAVGHWAFVVGVLISLLVGLAVPIPAAGTVLFLLGLVVGLLNVPEKESTPFLVAIVALLVIGTAGLQLLTLTDVISNILTQFLSFVSAAGLVVAVKQVLGYSSG